MGKQFDRIYEVRFYTQVFDENAVKKERISEKISEKEVGTVYTEAKEVKTLPDGTKILRWKMDDGTTVDAPAGAEKDPNNPQYQQLQQRQNFQKKEITKETSYRVLTRSRNAYETIKPPYYCNFNFRYSIDRPCGSGSITIANVTSKFLHGQSDNLSVAVFAGYNEDNGAKLVGYHQVVKEEIQEQGADVMFEFQTQMLPAIDRKEKITWTVPYGASILKSIKGLCDKFNIEVTPYVEDALRRPKTFVKLRSKKTNKVSGTFVRIMDDLCEMLEAKWLFLPNNDPNDPKRVITILPVDKNGYVWFDEDNRGGITIHKYGYYDGIVKKPLPTYELKYDGQVPSIKYSFEVLLNPLIKIGDIVEITGTTPNQPNAKIFVSEVRHIGSYLDDDWITSVSGVAVDNNIQQYKMDISDTEWEEGILRQDLWKSVSQISNKIKDLQKQLDNAKEANKKSEESEDAVYSAIKEAKKTAREKSDLRKQLREARKEKRKQKRQGVPQEDGE